MNMSANRIRREHLRVGMKVRGDMIPHDDGFAYTGTVRLIEGDFAEIERDDSRGGAGHIYANGVNGWHVERKGRFWGADGDEGYLFPGEGKKREIKPTTTRTHRVELAKLFKKYRKPHPISKEEFSKAFNRFVFYADYFYGIKQKLTDFLYRCNDIPATTIRKGKTEWL